MGIAEQQLLKNHIKRESEIYQDIIQGSFMDTYSHLSYKHVMGLKWFKYYCSEAKFLLKVDDDVVLNTPRVLQSLTIEYQSYWQSKLNEENDLILCNSMNSPQPVMRDTTSKWYVSIEQYSEDAYPRYCSGYMIFYARNTVNKLYEAAQTLSYFWIDDVFVTGLAREKANINATDLDQMTVFEYGQALRLLTYYKNANFKRSFVLSTNFDAYYIREIWHLLINETFGISTKGHKKFNT